MIVLLYELGLEIARKIMHRLISFKTIIVCSVVFFFLASAMEEEKNESLSFMENVAIGSAAGATEVVLSGQPLTFVKNTLQQKQKPTESLQKKSIRFVLKHLAQQAPSQYYRGIEVNAVCMVPTTAIQIGLSEKLKDVIPGQEVSTSLVRNGTAGAFAALVCTPSELVIVNQQNWNANARETMRRLYKTNGLKACFRGYTAKAFRDGNFCAGFLTAYPAIKRYVQEKTESSTLATILSTACVGPVTAATSHPFDTISTRMQADASKENIQGFSSAAKMIYKEGGLKVFFSGFTPRTIRILAAIPLMSAVKEVLSKRQ